jgi:hypothetical protein
MTEIRPSRPVTGGVVSLLIVYLRGLSTRVVYAGRIIPQTLHGVNTSNLKIPGYWLGLAGFGLSLDILIRWQAQGYTAAGIVSRLCLLSTLSSRPRPGFQKFLG